MHAQLPTLILLASAVLCLLLGPVVLLFLPMGMPAIFTGSIMLVYGAWALWIGMKRLPSKNDQGPPP